MVQSPCVRSRGAGAQEVCREFAVRHSDSGMPERWRGPHDRGRRIPTTTGLRPTDCGSRCVRDRGQLLTEKERQGNQPVRVTKICLMRGVVDNPRAEPRKWASMDRQWTPPAAYQSNRKRKEMYRTFASEVNGFAITARDA